MNEEEIKKILKEKKLKTQEIENIIKKAEKEKVSAEKYIFDNKIVSEEEIYKIFAKLNKLDYVSLKNLTINPETLNLVPELIAQSHKLIAFEKKENSLSIATTNPKDLQIFDFLNKKLDLEIKIFVTSPLEIKEALNYYKHDLESKFNEIVENQKAITDSMPNVKKDLEKPDLPITKVVDAILENAIFQGASDIHIEPQETEIIIRNRVDGILKPEMTLPKKYLPELTSRIKVLANLKIDEHRKPQDGRFKIKTDKYNFSFRVSIVPMFDGEKIVMRLLDETNNILALAQLGLGENDIEIIKKHIMRPNGLILVTGPTGSGKTTTLYTILNMLNTNEVNICTIEDPIEYKIPGINQSQINPKVEFTFATGLRSLLRQDPNIIMVGEIRDYETAEIAIHSSLTGHLVLSTLHTNDSVTSILRLVEMGLPAFLIGSTLKLVIAQRLARKVCSDCKTKYKLTDKMYKEVAELFDLEKIEKALKKNNILKSGESLKNIYFVKGKGCKKCNNEGYKGRVGIYEIFEINDKISDMISQKASMEDLSKEAVGNGMLTLAEDGFKKIIEGKTSLEEIIRVTKE